MGEKISYRNLLEMETIDKIHGKILASGIFQPLKFGQDRIFKTAISNKSFKVPFLLSTRKSILYSFFSHDIISKLLLHCFS